MLGLQSTHEGSCLHKGAPVPPLPGLPKDSGKKNFSRRRNLSQPQPEALWSCQKTSHGAKACAYKDPGPVSRWVGSKGELLSVPGTYD